MLCITITNCILIVVAFFIEDQSILDIFSLLDTVFLALYATECFVKMVAIGIKNYFDEGWYSISIFRNVFDLTLVIL